MTDPRSPEVTAEPWWLHLQRALGLVPLALYAGFHLWTHWPALLGREAWLARAEHYALGHAWGGLVLGLFALHGGLGILRARRVGVSGGGQIFQVGTGALLAGFVVFHLIQVWPAADNNSARFDRSYERLWQSLGQPLVLGVYVLGCGALAGHLAHGSYLWLASRLPRAAQAPFRYVAGLSGFVLFVLYLQLIGRFAAGEPMLPSARPAAADARYAALQSRLDFQVRTVQSAHAAHAGGGGQHVP